MTTAMLIPRTVTVHTGRIQEALSSRMAPGMSPGAVAKRDLERYYQALQDEVANLPLSDQEWMAVRDALNGTVHGPDTYRLVWASVDDAARDGLAEKWEIDGNALVGKLRDLSPAQAMALVDAVERWWIERGR